MATETAGAANCHLCGKEIPAGQAEDLKCYGCGGYFHDSCALESPDVPLGKHPVFAHEPDEDDE